MLKHKILVIVDAQNDFITGALANPIADERVPNIVNLINEKDWDLIITTYDTHYDDYMNTREGQKLPIPHCIYGTEGYNLDQRIIDALSKCDNTPRVGLCKYTFGSKVLAGEIFDRIDLEPGDVLDIYFCGFCTDICVVSNALAVKMELPNVANISVVANACAGVTPKSHEAALTVMKSCQIDII